MGDTIRNSFNGNQGAIVNNSDVKKKQVPSVGRIVHYYGPVLAGSIGSYAPPDGPCAAIVTAVRGDDTVDLVVFVPGDSTMLALTRKQESQEPEANRWMWPPRV